MSVSFATLLRGCRWWPLAFAAAVTMAGACSQDETGALPAASCPNERPSDGTACEHAGQVCNYFAGCQDYYPATCGDDGTWAVADGCVHAAGGSGGQGAGGGGAASAGGAGGQGASGSGTGGQGASGSGTGGASSSSSSSGSSSGGGTGGASSSSSSSGSSSGGGIGGSGGG